MINNFSTDSTREVVLSFEDPRIRCFDYRNFGVIAASRNKGIEAAKGDLIAFLDSDDLWSPFKLEKCIDALVREDGDLVCHAEYHFTDGNSNEKRPYFYGPIERTSYPRLLTSGNCLSTSAIVVKKKCLTEVGSFRLDAAINTAEDYDLWLRLSAKRYKILVIEDLLGSYRIHSQSASASVVKNARATQNVLKLHTRTPSAPLSFFELLKSVILFRVSILLY